MTGCRAEDHRLARAVLGPELDRAVVAAAGQPPVRQHRQGRDRAAVREDHGLARAVLGPELDLAVLAAAGQPPVRQHRQGQDRLAVREDHGLAPAVLGPELDLAVVAPPLASRPSASTARDKTDARRA